MARFALVVDDWMQELSINATAVPDIRIGTAPILGTALGEENTVGALEGCTPAGPVTFGRVSTDDTAGVVRAYVGEGDFTDDPLNTFGTRAVVRVPNLQKLMRRICRNGFEHHAAMNGSHCSDAVVEGTLELHGVGRLSSQRPGRLIPI